MKYTIYQILRPKTAEAIKTYCKYAFAYLDWIDEVKMSNYTKVYTGEIDGNDVNKVLEELFAIFNTKRPECFRGRSMSVSDVVKINDKYYYCDFIGWKEVEIK